jgi:hypothetical protein
MEPAASRDTRSFTQQAESLNDRPGLTREVLTQYTLGSTTDMQRGSTTDMGRGSTTGHDEVPLPIWHHEVS